MKNKLEQLAQIMTKQFGEFLNKGATLLEIEEAEKAVGIEFPNALREMYLWADGEKEYGPGLFFGLPFLSLEEMKGEARKWHEVAKDDMSEIDSFSIPVNHIQETYIDKKWIPISIDYGGNNIGIDMNPAINGKIGQVINFGRDEEMKYVFAYTLEDFIDMIIEVLQQGNFVIEEEEDYKTWGIGDGQIHIFDALAKLPLPWKNEIQREETHNFDQLFEQLDEQWQEIVGGTPNAFAKFLKKKSLHLMNHHLTHIEPLQFCEDLRELSLSKNEITSLEPLSNAHSLKKLFLVHNPITDLAPLMELKSLQYICLEHTNITSLEPLQYLPKLKIIELGEVHIDDYTSLTKMKKLESLSLAITNIHQLQQICSVPSLRKLQLESIQDIEVAELNKIQMKGKLKQLILEDVVLNDVNFIENHPAIISIELNDCVIKDCSALVSMKKLKTIELSNTPIENIKELANSTTITKFTGSYEQFSILKGLFEQSVDFSAITGGMTDEESDNWSQFLSRK